MSIHNSLKTDLPTISPTSSISDVKELLKSKHFSHTPIFNTDFFFGMLSKESIFSAQNDQKIADLLYEADLFFASKNTQWEEVMELFVKYDTNIIPVLDDTNRYIGYYQLIDFIHLFADTPFLRETGNFIILEKDQEKYSFSEITQIVESDQAKMLGIFISDYANGKVRIALKIITHSLSEILQTFRRYGYTILLEKKDDLYLQELKEKSDYFEKYLNI